jgi:DNA adenine methylase
MLRILEDEKQYGCGAPNSQHSKEALYGRAKGFSTTERVTLCRSIRRLAANGMIEALPGAYGCFRVTEKGRAWLDARGHDGAGEEWQGPVPPPLKWHGGKHYVAKRVLELMPPHLCYVEPYFRGGQVLFRRDPGDRRLWWPHPTSDRRKAKGVIEVINDRSGDLMNFYDVLADPVLFERLARLLDLGGHDENQFNRARALLRTTGGDAVARAAALFTVCRQSLSARMKAYAPPATTRERGGREDGVNGWCGAIEGLSAAHRRMKNVRRLCRDAPKVIRQLDDPGTLFYCDPPYLHETRTAPRVYAHEMTEADHRELLELLRTVKGKVMLSGYASGLYDGALKDWNRYHYDMPNHAAGGKKKRTMTEILWCNF